MEIFHTFVAAINLKMKTTKITAATFKSFVKKNVNNLFVNVTSEFDSMTDATEQRRDGFKEAKTGADHYENTLGIQQVWLVGQSRDFFSHYEDDTYTGIAVSNSCGRFIVAIKK